MTGGGGISDGDDQVRTAVLATRVSFDWRFLQADYMYHTARYRTAAEGRHFATMSWVRRARAGRARPFFQAGAGVVHRSFDTSLAVLFAGGVTVDLGRSLFIRPEVRLYGHASPTLTLLPGVAVGWRF